MTHQTEPLPTFLAEPTRIGSEISLTGEWIAAGSSGAGSMLDAVAALHAGAEAHPGVLSAEVNRAVGGNALLVHHVFEDADALVDYLSTADLEALSRLASPGLHLVRGARIPPAVQDAVAARDIPVASGEFLFGYVRDDYRQSDPPTAINVTAKWTCLPDETSRLDDLAYWWQRVGTDAHSMEEGLLRFEAYRVVGEDALIIHEVFGDTRELKFHLTKGTAARYKKDIDRIAVPERYFFRGPVSWLIRTYAKFMKLPATFSTSLSSYVRPGGNMSDGITG